MLATLSALSLGAVLLRAQSAPRAGAAPVDREETVELSPFVVTAEEDAGSYQATATLAGSRIRTDMKDVASSISVITSQFLKDTGATNNQTLLQYTTNTEVGGIYGNYAGVGGTFIEGASESAANLLRPSTNTRVRGLDSADNTRDFFQTDIPWDSFNVGRVDLQRGPNSILFGIGSPAGIINTSINTAGYKTEGHVENRIGSFGSVRDSFDITYVVIPDTLTVRAAAVYDDTKYRQQPAYNWDRRVFGAVRWDPKLFKNGRTTIRGNYEKGTVRANRPRELPPIDRITPYFDPTKINKQLVDGYYVTTMGIAPFSSSSLEPGLTANFWLAGNQGPGLSLGSNPVFYYDNSSTPMSAREGGVYGWFTIDASGNMGGHQLNGYPYGSSIGIASYNEWANNLAQYGATHGATAEQVASVAGAQSGFYKSKSIT
ncbi:MAG TPA: TonB-dependent receptor plug domain-containing protein, partial [Mycobacterium sp.]|nr:TonB-dependent receptor plug domain-containing protein [Mycobacterium sp.]